MNTETGRIQKLLKRNWEGPMWHGGDLKEILEGITWEKAFQKSGNSSHNVYELVKHMCCWRKFVIEHLKGNTSYSVELNSETDWIVQYEQSEVSWKRALEELEANQTELGKAFENFPEEKLDELVPGKKFNWYVIIHGCVHHDIYHSAQISILKK
ncbi:MAG: DinB family protein [Bacteroidota bacterium]